MRQSPAHLQSTADSRTFAPILQVAEFDSLEDAIALNNDVPQGLSSALFTKSLESMGKWLGPEGSDCGITNVRLLSLLFHFVFALTTDQCRLIWCGDRSSLRRQ